MTSTMSIADLTDQCRENNENIEAVFAAEEPATLSDFISAQYAKLEHNREYPPLQPRDDLCHVCESRLSGILTPDELPDVMDALSTGAQMCADHLGGLYSPQSFQGDLLFSKLIEKDLNRPVSAVPSFAFGSVALRSETYARGIQSFTVNKQPERLPLFVSRYADSAASFMQGLTAPDILRARDKTGNFISDPAGVKAVTSILDDVYLEGNALSRGRFADQVTDIGLALTRKCLTSSASPAILFIEAESVCCELAVRDLKNTDSLLYLMLHDERVISLLNSVSDDNGHHLSSLLFKAADDHLRPYSLTLSEKGYLTGYDIGGHETRISFDDTSLTDMLRERKLLPGTFLCALVTAMARGLTWYAGIFASLYMPAWLKLTVSVLSEAGYSDLADRICRLDQSGYISGPVFALYDNGEGAANAGPVEFFIRQPGPDKWDLWLNTDLMRAHEMGMFEFYHDLIPASEKKEGWYERIAAYNRTNNAENIL